MSTRLLSILLPAMLGIVALAAFIAVDFLGRTEPGADPNFSQYVAAFARKERAAEGTATEAVAALGEVPGGDAEAAEPKTEVVSRDATAPSSWFKRDKNKEQVQVQFNCVQGVGGSKVCTAETMQR